MLSLGSRLLDLSDEYRGGNLDKVDASEGLLGMASVLSLFGEDGGGIFSATSSFDPSFIGPPFVLSTSAPPSTSILTVLTLVPTALLAVHE